MPSTPFVLSSEQQAVVSHRDGHLQVVACAGSGKTEAIACRIARLLEDGTPPASIVAFTFTERAARSLQARVLRRVLQARGRAFLERLGPMFVGTMHGFCLQLLQTHVPSFGNVDVIDEHRLVALLSREHRQIGLDALGGGKHWRPIVDFLRNVDVVDNELIDAAALRGAPFGECLARFRSTLRRYHVITYGELISEAVRALADEAVFERAHRDLRHLFVDEYQDVNPAQAELVRRLAAPPVHLCVVGDDDQAIYQWRGASVSHIREFATRYRATSRVLSVNRRCRPAIVEHANAFARRIEGRLAKSMHAARDAAAGLEVHAWTAATPEDEANTIAQTVSALHARGFRYGDIGVLYRSVRSSAAPLVAALGEADVPCRCGGRTGLFRQPEADVLGATYAWLAGHPWKSERYGEPRAFNLTTLVDQLVRTFACNGRDNDVAFHLARWQQQATRSTAPVDLVGEYYQFLARLGVADMDAGDPLQAARLGAMARFSQILADFEHIAHRAQADDNGLETSERVDRGPWLYRRLFSYLQHYALDAYEDFEGEETEADAVSVMTVHQAKGLEWPVVFLPSLIDGRFPSARTGRPQDWLLPEHAFGAEARARYEGSESDERRLFYVALTRAKEAVYLSRFLHRKTRCAASPFFRDIAGDDSPAQTAPLPLPPAYTPPRDEAVEATARSFSELALYDTCPMRFRMRSVLGFQPPLARELGYGRAVHHVLRRMTDRARHRRRPPEEHEIETVLREDLYLPLADSKTREQLYEKARHLIARYLREYGDDLLRAWQTERPFSCPLERGIVSGRADVILRGAGAETPDELTLVDYKTTSGANDEDVFEFQLAIYTAAARGEGLKVTAAYVHDLSAGERYPITVSDAAIASARLRAVHLLDGIAAGRFPSRPSPATCRCCDVRDICRDAVRAAAR